MVCDRRPQLTIRAPAHAQGGPTVGFCRLFDPPVAVDQLEGACTKATWFLDPFLHPLTASERAISSTHHLRMQQQRAPCCCC